MRRLISLTAGFPLGRVFATVFAAGGQDKGPPRWREYPFPDLSGVRTPTNQFFLRSHLSYPRLEAPEWELQIDGVVKEKTSFRLEQLTSLPSVTRLVTFECSGNPPGGGLVSTAEWKGISLRLILEKVGVLPGAVEAVFEGADSGLDEAESIPLVYARSIPLDKALSAETMIVWEMNGARLPWEHGFPVRVVVPGYYAMSHVKWLSRIRLVSRPYKGFYMTKRYFTARHIAATGKFEIHPEIKMKIKSQIARPTAGELLSGSSTLISGAAWTGEGVVTRVEISTNGGVSWRPAELLDEPIPYSWRRWRYLWKEPENGIHTLICRAFDDRGGQQPESADTAVINRYGNNWYHRVDVTVRRA